jgi:hypothetical protein
MKSNLIIHLISVCFFTNFITASSFATRNYENETSPYCALLKNGKIILTVDGKQVYADVKLSKGAKVTTEGIVIYPDGSRMILKNGECIDKEGNVMDFSGTKTRKLKNDKTKEL